MGLGETLVFLLRTAHDERFAEPTAHRGVSYLVVCAKRVCGNVVLNRFFSSGSPALGGSQTDRLEWGALARVIFVAAYRAEVRVEKARAEMHHA